MTRTSLLALLVLSALVPACAAETEDEPSDSQAEAVTAAAPGTFKATLELGEPFTLQQIAETPRNHGCPFSLHVATLTKSIPTRYVLVVRKDPFGSAEVRTCRTTGGYRQIATSTTFPRGVIGVGRKYPEFMGVAYVVKNSLSGSSPTTFSVRQLSTRDGSDLRSADVWVKDHEPRFFPTGYATTPTNLSFDGNALVLEGTGTFPGATGTGPKYRARWNDFALERRQAAKPADSAAYY